MFTYTYDSDDEISGVIINPSLTYKDLQSLVRRTRKIIIKLYTECEEDYNTGLDIFFALIQEKILSKLLLQDDMLQDFALRRRLNEYMIPNNLERSVAFQQNPYQNPYQQNPYQPNVNKNQFIPPHFKQDVYKEIKRLLEDKYDKSDADILFQYQKSELDDYIEEEKNRVSGPNMLDPLIVAKDYFDNQPYLDQMDQIDKEDQMDKEYEDEENIAAAPALVSADPLAPDDDDDGAPPSTPIQPQPKPIAIAARALTSPVMAAAAAAPPPISQVKVTPAKTLIIASPAKTLITSPAKAKASPQGTGSPAKAKASPQGTGSPAKTPAPPIPISPAKTPARK
jgi:hypothetical protein